MHGVVNLNSARTYRGVFYAQVRRACGFCVPWAFNSHLWSCATLHPWT